MQILVLHFQVAGVLLFQCCIRLSWLEKYSSRELSWMVRRIPSSVSSIWVVACRPATYRCFLWSLGNPRWLPSGRMKKKKTASSNTSYVPKIYNTHSSVILRPLEAALFKLEVNKNYPRICQESWALFILRQGRETGSYQVRVFLML